MALTSTNSPQALGAAVLAADEFMRRFLLHVLPSGFHRIRHYGLIANNARKENLARVRELLQRVPAVVADATSVDASTEPVRPTFVCAHCGAAMVIIQTLIRQCAIRGPPQDRGAS